MRSHVDEHRWVTQIRRAFNEEVEDDDDDDDDIPVCIFHVPKALRATSPESYTPQLVALGPYHCWFPELSGMEMYKLSSAKRTQKRVQNIKFDNLVDYLITVEPRIRACYHKYLDINGETLVWMMAIDSCFLLEFLQIYATGEGKKLTRVLSKMSHLVDCARRKSTHNAILRDIVMLENQIPLFVLRKVLEFQSSLIESTDDIITSMLMGLCKDLSPFKNMVENLPNILVTECAHLLDYLYRVIVPKLEEMIEITEANDQGETRKERKSKKVLTKAKECVGQIPTGFIFTLPWILMSSLPGFSILKNLLYPEKNHLEKEISRLNLDNATPPLVEELMIPSAVELLESGVHFRPTSGGITSISFDPMTRTFHLPTINLDINTEVILRNLVAYEASSVSGQMIFTRYTELMNGIIDTEDDVRVLRERGIVMNHMKSDEEAAIMWNGMSKSLRLTKVPFLDEVIEEVNKYYEHSWRVKMGNFMKIYVFNSWKLLVFFAAVLMLFLMTVQGFCSIFYCSRATR